MSDFFVAAVFSDNSVLQRRKPICIFGRGQNGQKVTASLLKDGVVFASNDAYIIEEKWNVMLPPQEACEHIELAVRCGSEEKCFKNIAIGEVWLAGGQSNMEFELKDCTEGPQELQNTADPHVRFYYTQKIAFMDERFYEAEKKTAWQTWESEWKGAWSAVGYFFAKELAQTLGVTVGVIGCNWGGTSASAWVPRERLEKDSDLQTYLTEYDEATAGKSIEEQCREYDAFEKFHAEWQKKCDALYKEHPAIEWSQIEEQLGKCQWPGPNNCKNPYRPTGLYHCMLERVMPYTLAGFIYYQGESDDHKPAFYYKLFRELIDQWRSDWHDDTLPFLFVQLPEHRYKQDPDFKNWCSIRAAQAKIQATVRHTGMAVAWGLGAYNDIHPKAKKEIAHRLCAQALQCAYRLISPKLAHGPLFKSALSQKDRLLLSFDFAQDGFLYREDSERLLQYKKMQETQGQRFDAETWTGFEVAGSDGVFYPAQIAFPSSADSVHRIAVFSSRVPEPLFARYGWYNYGPVTVFGKNGLPLSPFSTEPFKAQQLGHATIQQIMEV